ncbi:hypothetical protein GCM10008929_17410 [Alkalibacterium psychrotolerans]
MNRNEQSSNYRGGGMNDFKKMQKLIKNKQDGGKDIQRSIAKNDQKYMRKAPIIFK